MTGYEPCSGERSRTVVWRACMSSPIVPYSFQPSWKSVATLPGCRVSSRAHIVTQSNRQMNESGD